MIDGVIFNVKKLHLFFSSNACMHYNIKIKIFFLLKKGWVLVSCFLMYNVLTRSMGVELVVLFI